MQKTIFIVCSLIVLGIVSCNNKAKEEQANENISYIDKDDEEINDAIRKAKASFKQFEKAFSLDSKNEQYYGFTIKEAFPTPDGSKEHMWIGEISFDGTNYTGVLANEPIHVTEVKYGDTITINTKNISDWMYFDRQLNLAHGGYTMRVYINKMSEIERTKFLQGNELEFAPIRD